MTCENFVVLYVADSVEAVVVSSHIGKGNLNRLVTMETC